jgi:hypothetical protein
MPVPRFVLLYRFRCSDTGGGIGMAPSGAYRFDIGIGGATAGFADIYVRQITFPDLGAG